MYCHDTRQNIYTPGMQMVPMMQTMPGMQMMPAMQGVAGMQMAPGAGLGTGEAVSPFLMAGVQPPETPVFDTQFTQGYLSTQIGSKVRVQFLLGVNSLQDRRGTLVHVGISYIILQEEETDDLLLCDIYSIKFVTFYK